MNKRKLLFAVGTSAAVLLSACGGTESSTGRVKNAALGKRAAVLAEGSCDDGEMIEGVDEDDCVISVKLGRTTRKAALQVLTDDGKWFDIDSMVAKRGRANFEVLSTDEDGLWLDGPYQYRVFAPRSGKSPEVISAEFEVVYSTESAEDDTDFADDDTEAFGGETTDTVSPEMQSAMSDIKQPLTKFDDSCTKIFDMADCVLMFRPGMGPDFLTLGKSKWVKMCSTLLKRSEAECEMMFAYDTSGGKEGGPQGGQPGQGGMQPGQGGKQPGQGGTMQPGQGGTMQPGQGGKQPGQGGTMQPGQGGTMQPGQGGTMQPGQQPPKPGKG